jgi:predicted RNA binding protein YcfA (HicA-like mRNA interferase family)
MTGKQLVRLLEREHGCVVARINGSHYQMKCGKCQTTVPVHAGEDIGIGLMAKIRRDLAPCLGPQWWKR